MGALIHDDLRGALLAPCTIAELVPPPRFAETTFTTYVVDPTTPGQKEAVDRIRAFALHRPPLLRFLRRRETPGLYLDGGFGVGKTHLLAAAWHAAQGSKRYLSFSEAMSLVILLGIKPAVHLLASDLICIDEFELDDPANTRLADLLLEELVTRGSRIMTTSNTVPGELGQGRMAADQFRNQLARIAHRFDDVTVTGPDHRRRALPGTSDPAFWGPNVQPFSEADSPAFDASDLDLLLTSIPIANLRRLASRLRRVTITGLQPFSNQLAALRFVNLIDRLYETCSRLRIQATCHLDRLFPEEHCHSAFRKKYQRCQSRLVELCA